MKRVFAFLLLIFSIAILSSCNALEITTCNPFYAMDTVINIKFYNVKDSDVYYQKIKSIYNKYDLLADDFKARTEANVYDLNSNRTIEANDDLIELINYSLSLKEKTNGYFNPLVGRLTHLWKDAITKYNNKDIASIKDFMTDELIQSELDIINSSSIKIENKTISIIGDANVDLGAIAKGYATKKCVDYLKDNNVEGYLINAGESSVALGKKGNDSFKVALKAPYSDKIIKELTITDASVASSSGKYQNAIDNNIRYHHIINPFTGYPSNIYDNVNIVMDNSALADCYSTAIFSMDFDKAKAFIEDNNLKAILYKDEKILYEKY